MGNTDISSLPSRAMAGDVDGQPMSEAMRSAFARAARPDSMRTLTTRGALSDLLLAGPSRPFTPTTTRSCGYLSADGLRLGLPYGNITSAADRYTLTRRECGLRERTLCMRLAFAWAGET